MKTALLYLPSIFLMLNVSFIGSAQDTISSIKITMNSTMDENKQAHVIKKSSAGSFNLILSDIKKVWVFEIDSIGKILNESFKDKPSWNLTHLLGGITSNGITTLFLTDNSHSAITSLSFGPTENTSKKIEFLSNKEKFVESFQYNDHFYFLTLQKHSSILTLYRVDNSGKHDSHIIDLSRFRFSNSSRNKLYTVVSDTINNTGRMMISKVNPDIPNTFDDVQDGGKLYIENGKMVLTLDNSTQYTILITVSLDNFSYALSSFKQPNTACENQYSQSNSYLYHGNLYQVKFCNEEIHFQVYDTCKKAVINRHLVTADNFALFRNTIISRVGTVDEGFTQTFAQTKVSFNRASKDLDSAKVTIKKITKGRPCILVNQSAVQQVITIGGESSFNTMVGGTRMGYTPAGFSSPNVGYRGGLSIHSEWTNYFRTLMDDNFNHLDGEIVKTAFDELIDYSKTNNKKEVAELLFKWNNQYILGYYDKETKQYLMVSFKEK